MQISNTMLEVIVTLPVEHITPKMRKDFSNAWHGFYNACAGITNFYQVTNAVIRNNIRKAPLHFLDWNEWVDFWYDNFPLVEDKLVPYGYVSQAAAAEPYEVVEQRLFQYINKQLCTL